MLGGLENIMKKENVYQSFLQIAWPVMAEGFFMELMSLLDLAMVGSMGFLAQAAVGINSQPKMMTLLIARGTAVAVTAVVSRRIGEKKIQDAKNILRQTLVLIGSLYFFLLLLIQMFLKQILLFSGAKNEYIFDATRYGRYLFIGLFFQVLSMMLSSSLVALGKTKIIFLATLLGNVLNCILNYMFIYGVILPKYGVTGVGIGTMCGNILTFLIFLTVHLRRDFLLYIVGKGWKPDFKILGSVVKVLQGSLPEQLFERIGMYLYTLMVAYLGAVELAVHHICMNICDIFYSISISLGTAMASLTGRALGEKEKDRISAYRKAGLCIGLIFSAVFFLVFSLFGQEFIRIFNQEQSVLELGKKIMYINALACIPQVYSLLHAGVLKGAGDTKYVAKYSLILIALIRPIITFCLIFILKLGVYGAWIALLMDQSLRAVAATHRFYTKKWMQIEL